MASETGIWEYGDSSKDFRSSASNSDSESEGGGIKLPAQRAEHKTVIGEALGQGLGRGIGARMGNMRDLKILSSTMEQFQELSQRLEEAHHPSNKLRPPSSSVGSVDTTNEEAVTQDQVMDAVAGLEDPFEGFDVIESEKDFLLSILDAAPTEELKVLMGIADLHSTTAEFYLEPTRRATVEEFAHTHPCWGASRFSVSDNSSNSVESEMADFKRDVYGYARAVGLGKYQARVEVMRAVAAWRKESGLGGGKALDDWDEDSYSEASSASPILSSRKPVMPLANSEARTSEKSKKRKRTALQEDPAQLLPSQAVQIDEGDLKRLKKALKKERRKETREMKKAESKAQKAVAGVEKQTGDHISTTPLQAEPISGQKKHVAEKPAKKGKKSKLGPKTSAYFAKPGEPRISTLKSTPDPPVTDENDSKTSHASKQVRNQHREAVRIGPEAISATSIVAPLKASRNTGEVETMMDNTALEPFEKKPSFIVREDELFTADFDPTSILQDHGLEVTDRKPKRKRKRNHNRLAEESSGAVKSQDPKATTMHEEAVELYVGKRSRTEAFVENLPNTSGNPSEAAHDDRKDVETEPKRKKNRRKEKQLPSVKPAVLLAAQELLPAPDGAGIIMDHVAKTPKQPLDSEVIQGQEASQPSLKKPRRDRARKAKGKHRQDPNPRGDGDASRAGEQAIAEPLSELADTNTESPKGGRQDRGRGRKRERVKHSEMDVEHHSLREHSKAHHSNVLAEEANFRPDEDRMQLDDTSDVYNGIQSNPQQEFNVVINTTSKIPMPSAEIIRCAAIAAQENDDDKVSVFSMADYGSLDWDHSGDESEFERASVSPKPERRASSAHQTRRRPIFDTQHTPPPQKNPRSNSCPAPVNRGRLARRVDKAAMSERKEELNSLQRPSSSSSATQRQRDRRGRFAKTPSRSAARSIAVVEIPPPEAESIPTKYSKAKKPPAKSPYFTAPISPPKTPKDPKIKQEGSPSKRSPGLVSCIPFPPLSAPNFGLIQEKLAHDPFRLLIAITFLIRTHGKHAIPVFYSLMSRYPTPQSLVEADKEDIVDIIRHLGLQNSRAATYQTYAKVWLSDPPAKGRRYAVKGYPEKDSGRDIARDEIIGDQDPRVAWEIGHMTSGPYALDSWRIFCRDLLRGVSTGWNGEGAEDGFQPEWMRVLPADKELRAYLRWMWLKEGFEWDPFTGEKEVASEALSRAAIEGRIAWDDRGGIRILDEVVESGELVQGGLGASNAAGDSAQSGKRDAQMEIPESDYEE